LVDCGFNTGCVDLMNDARNCGGCGLLCPGGTPCFFGECGERTEP
jgi:hypothetical protein